MTPRRVDPAAEPPTLEAMDRVMRQAYGVSSFRDSIDRFVATQPDGLVVVEEGAEVVGTGCCVAYDQGGFGWIGLVATAPDHQRRGIATVITERLNAVLAGHNCASVLDASAAGAPVYERMEFIDHGLTTVMGLDDEVPDRRPTGCEAIGVDDLDEVIAFDAERFGSPRPVLLATLLAQNRGRALARRLDGRVVGYLVAQPRTLGPVIADDANSLGDLISASLELDWVDLPRISVPPESRHLETLRRLGFQPRRELRHMRRGIAELPGRRDSIAAEVSLGEG